MISKNKKIFLTGGGTSGSVSPLLAISDFYKDVDYLWVGTRDGIERQMVDKENIKFISITSGKLRRYFSWKNFIDPFKIILAFFQSLIILVRGKPGLVMSAGGFVSVPVVWAAWILRIPVIIHQQDIRPGLANILMAPFAKVVTVTFQESLKKYGKKAFLIGNPVRQSFRDQKLKNINKNLFNLNSEEPIILIVGGGTGSESLNNLTEEALDELLKKYQVIHVTGKHKTGNQSLAVNNKYRSYEFIDSEKMAQSLKLADIVISRCGLGYLTELSYLGKPAILIPMPDTHQEDNAEIFKQNKAAIVLNQNKLNKEEFIKNINDLIQNKDLREELSKNIENIIKKDANMEMVKIIKKVIR